MAMSSSLRLQWLLIHLMTVQSLHCILLVLQLISKIKMKLKISFLLEHLMKPFETTEEAV